MIFAGPSDITPDRTSLLIDPEPSDSHAGTSSLKRCVG
jgi:hypothetical protein